MNSSPSFTDVDLGLSRVAVVAPAGFGKTETIADIVGRADRRVLVLTHTNAGVAALQRRMATKGTAANGCVMTIASWCERWVSSFPETSGYAEFASDETGRNKADDYYLKVYKAMEKLTGHGWVRKSLFSSYSRVIVDEYQDCTQSQHSLFLAISTFLPVLVFGDPLQGFSIGSKTTQSWTGAISRWRSGSLRDDPTGGRIVGTRVGKLHSRRSQDTYSSPSRRARDL
ncbi:MAG: UvrD-helicase domain-containing protein [Collinsella sp.]